MTFLKEKSVRNDLRSDEGAGGVEHRSIGSAAPRIRIQGWQIAPTSLVGWPLRRAACDGEKRKARRSFAI